MIKLNHNENSLGPSPHAIQAAQHAALSSHRYPDREYTALKAAIAEHYAIRPTQVTVGNGSENILDLLIQTYLTSTTQAIMPAHTFITIPFLLRHHGISTQTVANTKWKPDIHRLMREIEVNTRAIFLVNPGNPFGTYLTPSELLTLLDAVPPTILVVIDEAYAEFATTPHYSSAIPYLSHYPNLIITRTFSKAYGLAGLRLGYALSSETIAQQLNTARLPFPVNAIAAAAAQAALADQAHLKYVVDTNAIAREKLIYDLMNLNLRNYCNIGNFLTVQCDDSNSITHSLQKNGILVKSLADYGLSDFIRITVGTGEQNAALVDALANALALSKIADKVS